MTIKSYEKNGKTFYEVYVSVRSKSIPGIREQKRKKEIETKALAGRVQKDFFEECIRRVRDLELKGDQWGVIVDKWEKYLREAGEIQEVTIDDYMAMLRIWTEPIWYKPAMEINKSDIRSIIEHTKSLGKSNSFQGKLLNTIGRTYKWAREEGILTSGLINITSGIRTSRIEDKTPEILNEKQVNILLTESRFRDHRWFPIWFVAIFTGMRNGELFALEWTDIDIQNQVITVSKSWNKRKQLLKSPKSGYFRTIPMNDALKEFLIELQSKSNSKHVLPRIREWGMGLQANVLRAFCLEIGLPSVKFHTLRACFATHLLSKGTPISIVQKICGWSQLETLQRYQRLAGIEERGATQCLNTMAPKEGAEVLSLNNFRQA